MRIILKCFKLSKRNLKIEYLLNSYDDDFGLNRLVYLVNLSNDNNNFGLKRLVTEINVSS